jgi:hypothetical protein
MNVLHCTAIMSLMPLPAHASPSSCLSQLMPLPAHASPSSCLSLHGSQPFVDNAVTPCAPQSLDELGREFGISGSLERVRSIMEYGTPELPEAIRTTCGQVQRAELKKELQSSGRQGTNEEPHSSSSQL